MPRDDVERRVVHRRGVQVVDELGDHRKVALAVLVRRHGRLEVARVREAVGADGPERRDLKVAGVHLERIAARRTLESHGELNAALDDADLARAHLHEAELGLNVERALLWYYERERVRVSARLQ